MFICPKCKGRYESGEAFCPEDGSRLVSQSQFIDNPLTNDPMIGTVLAGRYEVIRPIGSGGMGVVYEAHHANLGRRFAIKILRAQVSQDADVVQRFQREAQSASTIGHENIIEVTDFGQTPGGASFMVMEFLEGQDLADLLAKERRLDIERALPILLQCCRALQAAHEKGIVHRDIKPENVFLVERAGEPDFVKIVDFGIAKISDLETPGAPGRKLTKTGMIFGTPEYMSTEQAYGRPTDRRSDIYGLGVIAYEMLTGHTPFEGETFMAVISQHMLDTPPPMGALGSGLSFHEDLEAIVARTMAKDPSERFQSMEELHEAFVGYMQREGVPGVPPSHPDVSSSTKLPLGPAESRLESPLPRLSGGAGRADPPSGILRLADEPERPPTPRPGPPMGVMFAALLAVAAAGAATLIFRPELLGVGPSPDAAEDGGLGTVGGYGQGPPGAVDDGAVGVEDGGSEPAEAPRTVAVPVDTRPSGGRVRVRGEDAWSAPCPCVLDLEVGRSLSLEGERGRGRNLRSGVETLTVAEEQGDVAIVLHGHHGAGSDRPNGQTTMHSPAPTVDGPAPTESRHLPTEDHRAAPGDLHLLPPTM